MTRVDRMEFGRVVTEVSATDTTRGDHVVVKTTCADVGTGAERAHSVSGPLGPETFARAAQAMLRLVATWLADALDASDAVAAQVAEARALLGASPNETLVGAAERVELAVAERARERDAAMFSQLEAARERDEARSRTVDPALAEQLLGELELAELEWDADAEPGHASESSEFVDGWNAALRDHARPIADRLGLALARVAELEAQLAARPS